MDIDAMTPDQLRRACRDLLRENEALRRRLGPTPPPFSRAVEAALDGMTLHEAALAHELANALRVPGGS